MHLHRSQQLGLVLLLLSFVVLSLSSAFSEPAWRQP